MPSGKSKRQTRSPKTSREPDADTDFTDWHGWGGPVLSWCCSRGAPVLPRCGSHVDSVLTNKHRGPHALFLRPLRRSPYALFLKRSRQAAAGGKLAVTINNGSRPDPPLRVRKFSPVLRLVPGEYLTWLRKVLEWSDLHH
jgi:hypothetical protein